MATTAEIRQKAAKKLGLVGTGQTLQSNIAEDLDNAYLEVFGEIEALGIAGWGISTSDVPAAFVHAIVSWVAGTRVDEYGISGERYQRIMMDFRGNPGLGIPSAQDRIRELLANPAYTDAEPEDF